MREANMHLTEHHINIHGFFYHNALSQITAKLTVNWMKEKGYYKRWLIPKNGLNNGAIYKRRPVGNRPGFMPLDNNLNAGI